jgi:hypothetical protein
MRIKMDEKQIDPLDEIFVESNEEFSRKLVAEILKPFLTIDPKGNVEFSEEYEKVTNMKKALIYLVAKKAMKLKGISDSEFAVLKEVEEKSLISQSDTKNALCTHYKKFVENKRGEGYTIPDYKLKKVKEEIFNGKK